MDLTATDSTVPDGDESGNSHSENHSHSHSESVAEQQYSDHRKMGALLRPNAHLRPNCGRGRTLEEEGSSSCSLSPLEAASVAPNLQAEAGLGAHTPDSASHTEPIASPGRGGGKVAVPDLDTSFIIPLSVMQKLGSPTLKEGGGAWSAVVQKAPPVSGRGRTEKHVTLEEDGRAQFTLLIDSGKHKKKFKISIAPKGQK